MPTPQTTIQRRVLVADDHPVLRRGLVDLLRDVPEIEVVGAAADGQQAVELAMQLKPDVVLMDVTMPRMDGIEATRRIVAALPGVRIIALSMHGADMAEAMLRARAAMYLSKSEAAEVLVAAVLGRAPA